MQDRAVPRTINNGVGVRRWKGIPGKEARDAGAKDCALQRRPGFGREFEAAHYWPVGAVGQLVRRPGQRGRDGMEAVADHVRCSGWGLQQHTERIRRICRGSFDLPLLRHGPGRDRCRSALPARYPQAGDDGRRADGRGRPGRAHPEDAGGIGMRKRRPSRTDTEEEERRDSHDPLAERAGLGRETA